MGVRIGVRGAAVLSVLTVASSAARGQTVVRRIGGIIAGNDSVVVSASDAGYISTVAFIGDDIAPAIATTQNARSWMRLADSVEHQPAPAAAGNGLHFDPIALNAVRGTMAYVRTARTPASADHALLSVNGGVQMSIALSTPQFDEFRNFVAQASSVTDSMTVASGHSATAAAGQHTPGIYFEFQADRPARLDPDTRPPHYPDMLRSARVEGSVLAQFVVDTTGLVELSTFKVLKSSHELFTAAVKDALPAMRFTPAEAGGMRVRQLVEMPFPFNIP